MQKAAIYARNSTEEQHATSLDDQVRRCKERATVEGYESPDALVFTDLAISGSEKGLERRKGYHALLRAIEAGECQAIIVTELSRLARDMSESLNFKKLIRRTGVRLLTIIDGIDSSRKGWALICGFSSVMAEHVIEETRERVISGMLGQLARGYQIAQAPFGYQAVKQLNASGESIGTHWKIDEGKAVIVREIYSMRLKAMSYCRIARELNDRGVSPPHAPRKKGAQPYWRPATVRQLLANPIFGGTFVWNGSGYSRAKAKKENRKLVEVEFPRKELAIVAHDVWVQCNPAVASRPIRAGRTHPLSGLVRCGDCGARLSLSSGGVNLSLHCAQCDQAKRVGVRADWLGYVSITGLQAAVLFVLAHICNGAFRQELNRRLKAKLTGDNLGEVKVLTGQVEKVTRACERLARQMREVDEDDEILAKEYLTARTERRALESKLDTLGKSRARANREIICAQIDVDPLPLLTQLMSRGEHADRTQATLGRLFPKIALVKRPGRGMATFEFHVVSGVAVAEASKTETIDGEVTVMRVQVTHEAGQPGQWTAALDRKK